MLIYHGSPISGLNELTYTEEQSRFGGEMGLFHGSGIYLTTSLEEAISYSCGGSYYIVKVKGDIFDATQEESINSFIKELDLDCQELLSNEQIQCLIKNTVSGRISAVAFDHNVKSVISNDIGLYNSIVCENFNEDLDKLNDFIQERFYYKNIYLNNAFSQSWVICLDKNGLSLKILEEVKT